MEEAEAGPSGQPSAPRPAPTAAPGPATTAAVLELLRLLAPPAPGAPTASPTAAEVQAALAGPSAAPAYFAAPEAVPAWPGDAGPSYRHAPEARRHRTLRQLSVVLNVLARGPLPTLDAATFGKAPSPDALALLLDLVTDPLVAAQLLFTGQDARLSLFCSQLRARRAQLTAPGESGPYRPAAPGPDWGEEEGDGTARQHKIHFPAAQKEVLDRHFRRNPQLSRAESVTLAAELSRVLDAHGRAAPPVTPGQVQTWFANRRKAVARAAKYAAEAAAEAAAMAQDQLAARGFAVTIDAAKVACAMRGRNTSGTTEAETMVAGRAGRGQSGDAALLLLAAEGLEEEKAAEGDGGEDAAMADAAAMLTAVEKLAPDNDDAAADGGYGAARRGRSGAVPRIKPYSPVLKRIGAAETVQLDEWWQREGAGANAAGRDPEANRACAERLGLKPEQVTAWVKRRLASLQA